MNKHFYRIVFNKARGLLMVVAEIVKRHQGEGRSSQKAKAKTLASAQDALTAKKSLKLALNAITVMSYLVFGWISLVQPSYATTIVVDKNADKTQRPTVTEAANGVTQVNIQAPTSGGVSHNKYTQFDVSDKGVILNNSYQASKTELAGYVKGNEFLVGSNGAKIILNEINSKNASQLAGYIEVAGQKAQVIIANAAGITCNGCGFINADRATLTTGKPIMENGKLTGYQVEQGSININGKGLDSSRQNYTDLIARTVSINADIWGDDIKVVAGRNNVSSDVKQITKLADNGSTRPQVAIDVSALGGMYAGKIQMVGTESGVGVNNSGHLGASAGSITISADGKIVNSGSIQAQKEIKLTSQQTIDNQKQIYAKGNIQLNSADNINNSGTIVAQNNIALNAKNTIQSQAESTIAAGVDERGKLTGQGGLSVQAKTITLQGQNLATQSIVLNAETRVNLDNSVLVGDDMTIEANDVSAKSAAINSSGSLDINASQTVNTSKSKITSQGEINIVANDIQNNESSWQSGQGMSLNASTINNRDTDLVSLGELTQTAKLILDNENSQLQAKGNINQVAQTINNKNSELLSEKNINLQADNANNEFSTIRAQGSITQKVINQLNNQATTFVSGGDMNLHADRLIQSQSSLTANGNIQITSNNIDNDEATLLSENIIIQAKTLSGGGKLSATNDITLGLENEFINKGEIKANNALTITSDKTISNHNQLVAGNILTLSSDALINEENAEISADNLVLKHETLDNQGLIDGEAVNISTTLLNNNSTGRIYGSDLTIQTQTLNNNGDGIAAPVIAARNNFNLAVDTLNNYTHGLLLSLGDFNIGKILDDNGKIAGSTQIINNNSSTIEAQGDLTITADTLNNINDNIITEEVLVDSKNVNEWSFIEAPDVRYSNDEVTEYCVGCGGKTNYRELKILSTGKTGTKYNHYFYTETTYETQVVETDPGKIISGGNLTLITNKTLNDNSHINAGNQLTLIGELENKVIDSIKKVTQSGTRYYTYDYYSKKGRHYNATETYGYNPLDEISSIDLGLSTIQDNIIINPNDTDLSGRSELGDNNLNTQEINVGSVSTVNPNTSLPDSSLYTVNKEADKNYLIETDSRFTNKKNWLSSDYMFEQLKTDPNNIQKRLGDGYYEQQLIKEQITALTGQRYLGDYSSDLEQYQALMNSGVEFANNYGLTVGVALTPE